MIVVQGLSKYYSGHKAIEDVSFRIKEGEIVGLLGLNGAGKSTILKILGCFLLPSGGSATVDGFSVLNNPHQIRKMIGYLPDMPPLYDEMTVMAYLRYVAKIKEVSSGELRVKVDAAIEKTNLRQVMNVRLGELSHGFRQRVGIAQAIVHEPKVLIFDEPITGLDPIQIVEMRDLIVSLKGRHTVILSSHILSEITKTCDRILIIDEGKLVAEGKESDLEEKLIKSMTLVCDVDRANETLTTKIRTVRGVSNIRVTKGPHGGPRLLVETSVDVRAAVAASVVGAGVGLLGFSREEAGLEGLFIKLIKSSGGGGNRISHRAKGEAVGVEIARGGEE